jgi:hypothetical protein
MNISVVRTLPDAAWRRFVDEHPASNIFHTPEMFEVFRRAKGYDPELWASVDGDGRVLALFLPVRVSVQDGLLSYLTTRAVSYGSVLYDPAPDGQAALELLLRSYRAHSFGRPALFTELRHVADHSTVRPLLDRNGFCHEEHLNYLVDLERPLEQIWEGVVKPARKAVERSRKRGVTVEEVHDATCLPAVYDLLKLTFSHAQVPLADPSLFQAALDILVPKGMAQVLLARGDDTPAATTISLIHRDTMFCWYIGFDKELHAFYPNDALIWATLEWGAQHGYRCYDFGGAGTPDKPYGPREFKAKFGGQLVNYGRAVCVHRPVALAMSRAGYAVYRKRL